MKFSAAIPATILPLAAVVAHMHTLHTRQPEPAPRQLVEVPEPAPAPVAPTLPPPPPASQVAEIPAETVIPVTPVAEITSKGMKVGDAAALQTAADIVRDGVTVIPHGSPVRATVTYRSGKGIFGKNAKFEIAFNTVTVAGVDYPLKGTHHQEGRGGEGVAHGGLTILTGEAAVMVPGQIVNAVSATAIRSQPHDGLNASVTSPAANPEHALAGPGNASRAPQPQAAPQDRAALPAAAAPQGDVAIILNP